MASYVNLYVDQYSDFETIIEVVKGNGDPIDLTTLNISGQIKKSYKATTSYDFTLSHHNSEKGELSVVLTKNVTSTMSVGRYVFDVFGTDINSGKSFKIIEGTLEILPSVTTNV